MYRIFIIIGILILIFHFSASSQNKINEKRALEKTHIDFSKEELWFVLSGEIEIGGHIFKNEGKCPIIYRANLDRVLISDTCKNVEYEHRACETKGCKIIHLEHAKQINEAIEFYKSPFFNYHNNSR